MVDWSAAAELLPVVSGDIIEPLSAAQGMKRFGDAANLLI